MQSECFIDADKIQSKKTDPGVRRSILCYDEQLMMVRVFFEKGAVGPLHRHPHRQSTFVVEGVFEAAIDGNKKTLKKGDAFFVAPDLEHGVTALEAGSLIDIFTPAREDFIK